MTETLNGLLNQKPGRYPEVGQTKCYSFEKKTSAQGKDYLKIRNSTPDKGGQYYRILSVQETGFTDPHGNISFSVELEAAPRGATPAPANGPTEPWKVLPPHLYDKHNPPIITPEDAVRLAKAHLARAANGMLFCLSAAQYIEIAWKKESGLDITPEQFQAITSTLFINLDKSGLIQTLPTSKPQPEGEEPPF